MRFKTVLPLLFLTSVLWAAPATADTAEENFRAGVASFEKKDWDSARQMFQKSLNQDPNSPAALFNLGMTEYKTGKYGLPIALWRKALVASPSYQPAALALKWVQEKANHPMISQQFDLWETARQRFFRYVSLSSLIFLSAVLLLCGGWLTLRYFGQRRRALLEEKPLPPPPWAASLLSFLFFVSVAGGIGKAIDQATTRGTIISPKVEVRTTPEANGTALFELFEGLEVIVRQSNGDWLQITYPGGQTGWIPKSALYITTPNGSAS